MRLIFIAQTIVSVLLISSILLQARGSGLGSAFGGQSKSYHTKRGFEKVLFKATIVFACLFVLLSLIALI